MTEYPQTKKELAAAFRNAGESFSAIIYYKGCVYRFLPLMNPFGSPGKILHHMPKGWRKSDIHTAQDHRKLRCEIYARRTRKLK